MGFYDRRYRMRFGFYLPMEIFGTAVTNLEARPIEN